MPKLYSTFASEEPILYRVKCAIDSIKESRFALTLYTLPLLCSHLFSSLLHTKVEIRKQKFYARFASLTLAWNSKMEPKKTPDSHCDTCSTRCNTNACLATAVRLSPTRNSIKASKCPSCVWCEQRSGFNRTLFEPEQISL